MSNRRNNQFTWNPHNKLTLLDCSFTVAASDTGGFGITGLQKSGRVSTVFMHTSQTPGTAKSGQVNPNPAAGLIVVTLQDTYNTLLEVNSSINQAPLSGTPVNISAGLTARAAYVITSLGTSTQANWQAIGLPSYIKAAVGVSFIATTASAGTGTGIVQASVASGIDHVEIIGQPNLMNSTSANIVGFGIGMQIILGCYLNSTLTQPGDGTVMGLRFALNDSAQGV